MKRFKKKIVMLICCAVLIVADQLTKLWATSSLQDVTSKDFIPGLIDFRYVENRGAAFGMLQNHRWVFIIPTVIIVLVCLYILLFKNIKNFLFNTAIVLIIAGGIGNLIDRIYFGYVIDFINFTFVDFYVFNIADCCVVVSVCLLVLYSLLDTLKGKRKHG